MEKATKHRMIARVVVVVLAATLAACSSSSSDGDSSDSIVGTRWDGTDNFGDEYQMYFDAGAALRSYAVDYDEWVSEDPNYEFAWSQEGAVVTVYVTDTLEEYTTETSGTLDGDHLFLEGSEDGDTWWLDLTRVD